MAGFGLGLIIVPNFLLIEGKYMIRNVPHQKLFDDAKKLDKAQGIILFLAAIVTITSVILNALKKDYCSLEGNVCFDIVDGIASLLAVAYMVLELLVSNKLFQAEKARRIDLIDHSFGTNFSGEQSTGYYNSGGINPGVYKWAVHVFENSLFSCNSIKQMTTKKWVYATIVFLVFLISAFLGEKLVLNSLIQVAAAGILVQQAIKFQQFSIRMHSIHSDIKLLFSNLRDVADKTSNEGEMAKNVIAYETTISAAGIILDDKIFNKDNKNLSNKWEQLKQSYKI